MVQNEIDRQITRAELMAKRKMGKIKSEQRYDVESSAYNPISDKSSMNTRQKQRYLTKLRKFNSKETELHVSGRGTVLSAKLWKKYKQAEARANEVVRKDIARYSNLPLPRGDGTLGEYLGAYRPGYGKLGHSNPSGTEMHEMNREPKAVSDDRSLRKLIAAQERKASPNYTREKTKQARDQFQKMVEATGDDELLRLGEELSDEQFMVIWNYTNFANSIGLYYETHMQRLIKEQPFHAGASKNSRSVAYEWVEWASQIL